MDLYIRNHGSEQQFTPEDLPFLREVRAAQSIPMPGETTDQHVDATNEALDAMIGAFNSNPAKTSWALCCSPHGNMGLFYAWDGTLRHSSGVVRVNLLLNRASPWIDVDSYLPYEGKVVLRNKSARELFVRIPLWVDESAVDCRIGQRRVPAEWFDRYLRVRELRPDDVVTITFPMVERTEEWSSPGQLWGWWPGYPAGTDFSMRFRGNTLVEMSPAPTQESPEPDGSVWWPYSSRAEKYEVSSAPTRQVTRFVTDRVLRW